MRVRNVGPVQNPSVRALDLVAFAVFLMFLSGCTDAGVEAIESVDSPTVPSASACAPEDFPCLPNFGNGGAGVAPHGGSQMTDISGALTNEPPSSGIQPEDVFGDGNSSSQNPSGTGGRENDVAQHPEAISGNGSAGVDRDAAGSDDSAGAAAASLANEIDGMAGHSEQAGGESSLSAGQLGSAAGNTGDGILFAGTASSSAGAPDEVFASGIEAFQSGAEADDESSDNEESGLGGMSAGQMHHGDVAGLNPHSGGGGAAHVGGHVDDGGRQSAGGPAEEAASPLPRFALCDEESVLGRTGDEPDWMLDWGSEVASDALLVCAGTSFEQLVGHDCNVTGYDDYLSRCQDIRQDDSPATNLPQALPGGLDSFDHDCLERPAWEMLCVRAEPLRIELCDGELVPQDIALGPHSGCTVDQPCVIRSSQGVSAMPASRPVLSGAIRLGAIDGIVIEGIELAGHGSGTGLFIDPATTHLWVASATFRNWERGVFIDGAGRCPINRQACPVTRRALAFTDNIFEGNRLHAFAGQASDLFIARNRFERNEDKHVLLLSCYGPCEDVSIVDNHFGDWGVEPGQRCDGGSITVHGRVRHLLIARNRLEQPADEVSSLCWGIGVYPREFVTREEHRDVVIRDNEIINAGGRGIEIAACTGCLVEGNTIVHHAPRGLVAVRATGAVRGAEDVLLENVVVRNNSVFVGENANGFVVGIFIRGGNGGYYVFNNAIELQNATGTTCCFEQGDKLSDYRLFDYNVCLTENPDATWGLGVPDLSAWRSLNNEDDNRNGVLDPGEDGDGDGILDIGFGHHSRFIAPGYTDPAESDLRPQAGSPMTGTGYSQFGMCVQFSDVRFGPTPNIGAR